MLNLKLNKLEKNRLAENELSKGGKNKIIGGEAPTCYTCKCTFVPSEGGYYNTNATDYGVYLLPKPNPMLQFPPE
jgi:hypothetical protein